MSVSLKLPISVALVVALTPAGARAQGELETKRACAVAYEQAQRLRQDDKLVEARQEAVACAQSSCPALLTADCAHWVEELDQSLPSVIVDARDEAGKVIAGLRVALDGRELPHERSGLAFTLNPGRHRFRFQAPGRSSVEREEVIVQGRKNQHVEVTLPTPAIPPAPVATRSGRSWLYATGSATALGALGFAYFGLIGRAREDEAKNGCAPRCGGGDLRSMKQAYLVADISLGLALVGVATSVALIATGHAPWQSEPAPEAHVAHNEAPTLRKLRAP